MDRAPVGDHEAFKAPLFLENRCQQLMVLGAIGPVELVVGAHDRPGPRLFHCGLEGRQVDLAQCALVDGCVDAEALGFLVVRRKVLQRGADALALNAFDVAGCQFAGQVGIFGEILEVAPAEGRALHVDAGTEHHVHAQGDGFGCQRLAQFVDQLPVPRRGQAGGGRETGGGQAGRAQGMDVDHAAQAVGAVSHKELRHAQASHRRRRPGAGARAERRLLFQGHLLEDGLEVVHVGLSLLLVWVKPNYCRRFVCSKRSSSIPPAAASVTLSVGPKAAVTASAVAGRSAEDMAKVTTSPSLCFRSATTPSTS